MGLITFTGDMPSAKDATIAKNYLEETELKILNNLVSGYFDFAEVQAMKQQPMHMQDYVDYLDKILASTGEKVLIGPGRISHIDAMDKAKEEYKKYQAKTLSSVEKDYLISIKQIESTAKNTPK